MYEYLILVVKQDPASCVAACRVMKVVGVRGKGRGRKTWDECVSNDMRKFSLTKEMAQDRNLWRLHIQRKPSNPC